MGPQDDADVINRTHIGKRSCIVSDDSETGAHALTGLVEKEHCVQFEARIVRYTEGPGFGVHGTYGT